MSPEVYKLLPDESALRRLVSLVLITAAKMLDDVPRRVD